MTRIGFAYNQKPQQTAAESAVAPARDEEPPSSGSGIATLLAPSAALLEDSDEFAEWDSKATIDAVAYALGKHGSVIRLEATDDFPQQLRDAHPDIVFNIAEGLRGPNREAHVPAICEFYGIPYSGSDPFTLSACLDKTRTKELLRARGVRTVDWWLIRSLADIRHLVIEHLTLGDDAVRASTIRLPHGGKLAFPLFAKPVHEGSSKGITERNFIANESQLYAVVEDLLGRYQQPVIVEEFLSGAEFTCGVLGNGASARMLPIVALNFAALPATALPIYGYEAKWLWDRPENPLDIFECPAKISATLEQDIEKEVLGAYHALGCRDWSRIDVRLDAEGAPHIIEVNPLPGILPDAADNSCLPKAARAAGLDYDSLIGSALQAAADRNGILLSGARS